MKAEDFDKRFDEGAEDIIDDLELKTARRANQEFKRINVEFHMDGMKEGGDPIPEPHSHSEVVQVDAA